MYKKRKKSKYDPNAVWHKIACIECGRNMGNRAHNHGKKEIDEKECVICPAMTNKPKNICFYCFEDSLEV